MCVDDMVAALFDQPVEFPKRDEIRKRIDAAAHFGQDDQMSGLASLRQQLALAAFIDAADERDLVFGHCVEADDREQSVLLRTANDHPRDDVQDAYRFGFFDCFVLWQGNFDLRILHVGDDEVITVEGDPFVIGHAGTGKDVLNLCLAIEKKRRSLEPKPDASNRNAHSMAFGKLRINLPFVSSRIRVMIGTGSSM